MKRLVSCAIRVKRVSSIAPTEQGLLYLQPLQRKPPDETSPWFCDVAVGKNTLQNKLKTMCAHVGIEGNKINHSLSATGARELPPKGYVKEHILPLEGSNTHHDIGENEYTPASAVQVPGQLYRTELEANEICCSSILSYLRQSMLDMYIHSVEI